MRYLWIALCALLLGQAIVGVEAGEKKKWRVGFSQCNLGEPWRAAMYEDLKREVAKYPDDIELIHKDAQLDTARQQAQLREFLNDYEAGNIDCILVSPKESAPFTPIVAEIYKSGCPVLVIDREILTDDYTCFIGGDNVVIGRAAGEWLVAKFGGKRAQAVELTGLMTVSGAQERNKGFVEGIKGSDIEIIFKVDANWMEPQARKEMESALSRFDKIDFVYAHNDPMAHGAYLAAKAAGREKDIVFVGVDGLQHEGVAYVKQGILDASFLYPSGMDIAIEQVMKLKRGENIPKRIMLATKVFDAETPDGKDIGEPVVKWTLD
ncbi:MAG: substrate-binding domain-containing protein [Planctomycetota bacterium]|jgi:ribose transport system substrate-binding protein|nr:substrate-binding domain-containing protein [Planctomycetota bacterium]